MKHFIFKGKEWKSHFPLLTLPSFHLQSLSSVREGNSSSKSLKQWLWEIWVWKTVDTSTAEDVALAPSWQVPSPASPHCSRTVLVTIYRARTGPERAGGAHASNHPSFEGTDLLGGELLPSACPQALPKAPHAADPCINNTLGPKL